MGSRPVLFVSTTGVMGGAEVYLIRLMRALEKRGRDCSAVVPARTALHRAIVVAGMNPMPYPKSFDRFVVRGSGGRLSSRATALLAAPFIRVWLEQLRSRNDQILHLNSSRAAFVGGSTHNTVLEVKDALCPPFFSPPMARAVARRFARSSTIAIANSRFVEKCLILAGYPAPRIRTILNGLDLDEWRPLSMKERAAVRLKEGWPSASPVVICVGRFARWKGQDLGVEAFALFRHTHPGALLVLVGEVAFDGQDFLGEVRRRVSDLGIRSAVLETGFRSDVRDLVGAADILMHTSTYPEPLGLTPIEAQALGVPAVAAAAGGPLETVEHLRTGYLFKPGDVSDLSSGLDWAAGSNQALLRMQGRAHVERKFDIDQVAGRYEQVYDTV